MSECRSFGSHYYPSSQSRKISIGVMADCLPGRKPGLTKADENATPRVEKLNVATRSDVDANKKHESIPAANVRNAAQAPEHVSSPLRTPKSSRRKLGTLDNVLCRQTSNFSGIKELPKDANVFNQGPAVESLQQFATSNFQSGDGNLIPGEIKKWKDGSLDRVEEFASAAAREKIVSGGLMEEKVEKVENRGTEALRTKLWEILGTASSPRSHHSNSKAPEVRDNGSNRDQKKDPEGDKFAKPRINLDTTEGGSESPETTRRPVTRSLLRKEVSTRAVRKTSKSGAHSSHANEEQKKTIFSFQEGLLGKVSAANVSSPPKNKKTRRKTTTVQNSKFESPKKDEAKKIQREKHQRKTLPSAKDVQIKKTSFISHKQGSVDDFPPQTRNYIQKPLNGIMEEDFHQSQAMKPANKLGSRSLSENGGKLEEEGNPSAKKAVDPHGDLCSPTFGFRTPASSPSPCFSPGKTPMHSRDNSLETEETETPVFSFGTKKASQAACYGSNADRELSDVLEKSRDYSFRRRTSSKLDEDSEDLSESSSDEGDSTGSGEDSPLMENNCDGGRETSPQGSRKKPKFVLPSAKRNSSLKGTRLYEPSPGLSSPKGQRGRETSPQGVQKKSKFVSPSAKRDSSPKGTGIYEPSPTLSSTKELHETDCFLGSSGVNEDDDGLGRAVSLFALALQNFEKKLKSAARKKSSEILASVSEEVHLQMENAESRLLTDVGKLSNITKTKRKHAETRFREHQEHLRLLHEKFKDDIGHHLQDFKSTLEDLEANRTELKGAIKKQKASHQQLITRLEGEVETQLVNAERRIINVNESARGKMLQLKKIVAECLKDDILN